MIAELASTSRTVCSTATGARTLRSRGRSPFMKKTLLPSRPTADVAARSTATRPTLVIVGNGPVGWKLCEQLAQLRATSRFDVIVFGEEPRPAYDRVRLSELFDTDDDETALQFGTRQWYADRGIALHLGDPVVEIEPATRRVRTQSGQRVVYDRLVLATGSRAFKPPLPGIDRRGVYVYRTLDDVRAIQTHLASLGPRMVSPAPVRRAAVLGGGLLGLEAVKVLLDTGLEVHVFEMAAVLMPRQLDTEAAALLRREVEALGVHVHTLSQAEAIEKVTTDMRVSGLQQTGPDDAAAGSRRQLRLHLRGDDPDRKRTRLNSSHWW